VRRLIRILVPVALIAAALAITDPRGVVERLAGVSLGWLVATVALLTLIIVLSALRWRITALALGLPLTVREVVEEYYLSQFINQTLPGGVLGDAARAVRSRQGGPLKRAAQAVVLERASGQVAMAAILALALAATLVAPHAVLPGSDHLPDFIWLPVVVLAIVVLAIGGLAFVRVRAGGWGEAVRVALIGRFAAQTALSLSVALLTIAAFVTAARATGTSLPPAAAMLIVPLILTAMLLPASVAGWGWREGAAAALFPIAGSTAASGVAASIAFGLAVLVSTLPGAFFALRGPHRRVNTPRSVAQPPERPTIAQQKEM
jgi:glycosyltransferase 2 family protein